jgi:anaerobic magnesium-protoporphyrin IX monomethyl ester cyclase
MASSSRDSLRILLINSINPHVEVENRYPNLGLGYLASSLRRALPELDIQFVVAEDRIGAVSRGFRPHLAAVTTVSQNFPIAQRHTATLAEQGIPLVLGGVHISALPRLLPREAAAACLGEGELTFVQLVRALLKGGLTAANLAEIEGIAYWDGERLEVTPPREPVSDLDSLPRPDRDLLDIRRHTYMFTSRGCPYNCTFCSSTRFWEKTRFFSAEYVVDEIELLRRQFGATMISFFDDLFVAKRSRLEDILRLLEKRGLLGKIKFTCNLRANTVDREIVRLLSGLGVVSVGLGLESGDDSVLRYLKGGAISVKQNFKAVELIKDGGIFANASFIIGSPGETEEAIFKTYDFIRRSRLDLFDVYILTPYPGTPVWEYAKGRGLVTEDDFDWSRLDVNLYRDPDAAVCLSDTLDKDVIIAWYKKFRRLRFRRNLTKVINHPLRRDLPKIVSANVRQFLGDRLRRPAGD